MSRAVCRRVVVIGVGNSMRRDDGAGLAVVARARPRLPRTVSVTECRGDATRLLDAWEGAEWAVVVDAARWPGASPGEVAWIADAESGSAGDVLDGADALGTHGLGVAHAIRLGRALGRLPGRLALLAVAVDDAGYGTDLCAPVEHGVDVAAGVLVEHVRGLVAGDGETAPRPRSRAAAGPARPRAGAGARRL
jgi:hydrogenase maturation protease